MASNNFNSFDPVQRFLKRKASNDNVEYNDIKFQRLQQRLLEGIMQSQQQVHQPTTLTVQEYEQQQQQQQQQSFVSNQNSSFISPPMTPNPSYVGEENEEAEDDYFDEDAENAFIESNLKRVNELKESAEIDKEAVIDIIKEHPHIWMASHQQYKDNNKKKATWQYIHEHHFQKRFSCKYCF